MSNYERQQMYLQHRRRVLAAKSVVNSQPPQRKLKFDENNEYVDLMASLNERVQNRSVYRTFTKSPIMMMNPKIRLPACPQSDSEELKQQYHMPSQWIIPNSDHNMKVNGGNDNKVKSKAIYDIPGYVLQRYQDATPINDLGLLRKLLRPRIFFDLEVKGERPLGRLDIQLFTEACPEVVLEFVRACSAEQPDRLRLTRLFAPLWMEGDILISPSNGCYNAVTLEHDMNAVDHGWGPGILSFPCRYLRGNKRPFLTFSISFKPLNVLNGKRVAFGKVRRGLATLDSIQDFSQMNGKPTKKIEIINCGVLK